MSLINGLAEAGGSNRSQTYLQFQASRSAAEPQADTASSGRRRHDRPVDTDRAATIVEKRLDRSF